MLIRVMSQDNKYDMVKDSRLDELMSSGRIKKFYRSGDWVNIKFIPLRGMGGSYHGPERRRVAVSENLTTSSIS